MRPVLIIFFLFFSEITYASHAAGLDITYECISSNQYRITVRFYRECSGIGAPFDFGGSTGYLNLSNAIGYSSNFTLNSITSNPPPVYPNISSSPSCPYTGTCSPGGSTPQTEVYTYQGIINLPYQRNDWTITAAMYARNPSITTVTSANNYSICVQAIINNTNSVGCNSSPTWNSYPPGYLCVNSNTNYSVAATDLDGDSLVYSLINPLNNYTGGWNGYVNTVTNVPYNGGYNFMSPYTGTISFDPLFGNMSFFPTSQLTTIWAVKLEEYRNGVLIGSIIRDIQSTILSCNNNPPNLTGIDTLILAGPLVNSFNFCANGNSVMTFDINGLTSPPGGSTNITMSVTNLPNNSTFTISNNNTNNPIGTFTWIPQYADLLNSPFFFTVDLIDDACISNTTSYTYQIDLTSSSGFTFVDITQNVSCPGFSDGSIDVTVGGVTGVPIYSWIGPNGFTANTEDISNLDTGQYILSVTDQDGCTSVSTYNIGLNSYSLNTSSFDISCNGLSDGSVDLSVFGGTLPYTYLWSNGATTQDLTNIPAGFYSVVVTDGTGCSSTLSNIEIQEPSSMSVSGYVSSSYNGQDISCYGGFDGQITASISGGMFPYTYAINNSSYSTANTFNGLTAGTYNISYKDANGCVISENINLTQPTSIQTSIFNYNNISCWGYTDGLIDIEITGGTQNISSPFYNVSWTATNGYNSSSTDLNFIGSPATYTATITDANGCLGIPISQYISEPLPLEAQTTVTEVSCYGYSDGSIDLTVTGGAYPYIYTYIWTDTLGFSSVLEDIQGLTAGTYTYDVVDQNGCSLELPILRDVLVPEPAEIIVSSIVTLIDCYGNTNGSIDLNITGITGTPNISWTGPNNFYSNTSSISGLSAGIYNVVVTDPTTSCTFPLSEIMNPISTYNIDTNSVDITCRDSSDGLINITSYNLINPTYTWSGPAGFSSLLEDISGLSPGFYQVLVNDDNNCPVTYTFNIKEPNALSVLSSISRVACEGGSDGEISLIVTGGTNPYSYTWSNAANNLPFNNNLSAGPYSVTVSDGNNCIWNENYVIETEPFDTIGVTVKHIKCKGYLTGEIDINGINGGVAPYNYLWSNGSNLEDLIYIGAGTYNVSITDATGCTINRYVSITEPSQEISVISTKFPTKCFSSFDGKATLNISGGIAPYSVDWLGVNPDSLGIGLYQYQVIDSNSCMFTDDIIITGPDSMILSATNITHVQCYGEKTGEINLTVQSNTGTSPYSYSWKGPNLFTSNNKDIYNLSAGEYTCTVTDDNDCQVEATFNITQPDNTIASLQLSTPNYSGYNVSCKDGDNGWIEVDIEGGVPPFSFLWDNGETTQNIYDLSAGIYQLTLSDALLCNTNYEIYITEPATYVSGTLFKLDYASYGVSCYGKDDGMIFVQPTGGVGGYTYDWTKNNIPIIGVDNDTLFNLYSDNYQLFLYDQNGCLFSDSITLSEPDPFVFDTLIFAPDTCELGKGLGLAQMKGGVLGYQYFWTNVQGDTLSLEYFVDTLSEGNYYITVQDTNLCTVNNNIFIDNLASPIADFTINPYRRKFQEQLDDPFVFIDNSQTFEQQIISWNWDFQYNNMSVNFIGSDSIISYSYSEVGLYNVLLEIETEYNCFDTITKKVLVDYYDIFIPDAFTPGNGDDLKLNDTYKVSLYPDSWLDFKIIIYSKWGGIVYSSDDPEEGWDGTINNNGNAISGAYTYYIEVRNIYDEIHKYEGIIKLLR